MKLTLLLVIALIAILSTGALADGRADGDFLRTVSRDYVTPHLEWAPQLPGGPIKTLIIVPRNLAAREVVELAQRMALNYEAVATYSAVTLANEIVYEATVTGTNAAEKSAELLEKLNQPYEAIVIANVDFNILPAQAQYKILEQVSRGTGLLMVYPRPFANQNLFAAPTDEWKRVLRMVDVSSLPGAAAKAGEKLVRTYRFGKGRIGTVNYPGMLPAARYGGPGLTASEEYTPGGTRARFENNMAFIGRALQWTAGRSLDATAALELPAGAIAPARPIPVRFHLADAAGLKLHLRLRDEHNELVWQTETGATNGEMALSLPALAAGSYYLDTLLVKGGTTQGFGVFRIDVASTVGTVKVSTDKPSYESGESMAISVSFDKPLAEPAEVRVEVRDLPAGRTWHRERVAVAPGQTAAKLTVRGLAVPTVAGVVRCDLSLGGQKIASAEKIAYFPRRKRELFPTILWGSIPAYSSEAFAGQIMTSIHDPIGLTHPEAGGKVGLLAALFDQRFAPYLTRVGLTPGPQGQTLSATWLGMSKEEVEQGTRGDGSFYNPAVKAFWKRNVERRMEGMREIGPPIYTLGDENGFSYEAGYSAADEPAFRAFLKQRYSTVDRLNQEWGTKYGSFEAAEHLRPDELRKQQRFSAWYDHRCFMEQQYADVHHYLAECIKAIDPHAQVGAEGSVPGDLEKTISKLDFWGPYTDSVLDEVLRCLAPRKLRTIWWGYGPASVENGPVRLWRSLLQGTINGSAWYSSGLESGGLLSIDLSLAKYYRKIQGDIRELDRGGAQLLTETPLKSNGIAILWSHASYSASFMDTRFFKPADSANTFMNFCYREGLNFDYVTSKMASEGGLAGYKVLCLFGASVLSPAEKKAIEEFEKRGGLVIADINPGVLNEFCRPLPASSVGSLFGTPQLTWQSDLKMRPVSIDRQVRGHKISFQAGSAYQSLGVPLFSVKDDGPGTAVLLNFNLGSAASTAADATPMDGFLRQLLNVAGVKPAVKVEGLASDQALIRVRENARHQVIGLMTDKADLGREITLKLPRTGWIYSADKVLVAHTDTYSFKLSSPFQLFTVYSTKQAAPDLSLDKNRTTGGAAVHVKAGALQPDALYRLEVLRPDGAEVRNLTTVCRGAALREEGQIRLAFNDPLGQYQVRLTDVGTGLHSTTKLVLETEGRN